MTRPRKKSRRKRDSNPGPSALERQRQGETDRQRKRERETVCVSVSTSLERLLDISKVVSPHHILQLLFVLLERDAYEEVRGGVGGERERAS